MNASQQRFGADDLGELLAGASRVVVAKGKRVLDFDLRRAPPEPADLQQVVLGPTGNLRAPTIRVGRCWLVGFHEDSYADLLDA